MAGQDTSPEIMVKILLDEANLAFSEAGERKDSPGERTVEGSAWDFGRMEGEYDETDFQKILELQLEGAKICDEHPELEDKTAELFQKVSAENAQDILKEIQANAHIGTLARISVMMFLYRFPTVHSFVNKGHPLVLATDEYMLENADKQNWCDYINIAEEMGWKER